MCVRQKGAWYAIAECSWSNLQYYLWTGAQRAYAASTLIGVGGSLHECNAISHEVSQFARKLARAPLIILQLSD
jgi:hypothetical protein